MITNDGKKTVTSGSVTKQISCTRFEELKGSVSFHIELARRGNIPTEFRFLNNCPVVKVGGADATPNGVNMLMDTLSGNPSGGTPLCRHINECTRQIRANEGQLRQNKTHAVLIICTDGESSDGDLANAMRPLEGLPVWVVVNLKTDEDRIVSYWNSIDEQLELEIDVLDDYASEAQECYAKNPWLTYSSAIHALREGGIRIKEFDLLDEGKLSLESCRFVCSMLLGGRVDDFPHPEVDFEAFRSYVSNRLETVPTVYSPVHKSLRPVIDINALSQCYGKRMCVIM